MKTLLAAVAVSFLAGCGVETATTAATSAEIKRREMEQAKKSMEMAKQKLEAANEQVQQRLDRASEAAKD
jgi:outer membrane lipopolysaccharide assembly protein LptE/RlpB